MFNAITHSQLFVLDQDEALDFYVFYVGKLGLEVTADVDMGFMRRLTVSVPFTEKPTERPYGIDCALRDPFGNPIRFTQLKV
ncbi:VOC family protein [Streptomyces griseoaurantiacus]|uniref:hypothetical protein n=1 Tax=Streptomyces griseoaurantiacus TaxID=68213 RepID=UPI0036BE36B7